MTGNDAGDDAYNISVDFAAVVMVEMTATIATLAAVVSILKHHQTLEMSSDESSFVSNSCSARVSSTTS